MKKLIAVLSIAALFLCVSCRKEKQSTNQNSFSDSSMLSELKTLNDSIFMNHVQTKSARSWFVASMDVVGIFNGSSDGGNIGFWAGLALGNPAAGKVIGSMVGGLLYGAAYSYIAYAGTSSCNGNAEDLYNLTVNTLIASQQLDRIFIENSETVDSNEQYATYCEAEFDNSLAIDVPTEFSNAEFVANGHNIALASMLQNDYVISSMESSNEDVSLALNILLSEELKNKFQEDFTKLFSNGISYETLRDTKASETIDLYLQVFELTADDVDSTVDISNKYIDVIDKADELTIDEKMCVFSSLAVAAYSTDFWIAHFQTVED